MKLCINKHIFTAVLIGLFAIHCLAADMPQTPEKCDAEIFILGNQSQGSVDGMLFGQFIGLSGKCINGGLYDPGSPQARSDGVRKDVLEALRELRPTHIRYPGGCEVAYFDWQELVGPPDQRPRAKLFRASAQTLSTAFGIPEAWALCRELGAELYLTVNAHTQSPEDAANLVEYLNGTTATKWADLRRAHGRAEPFRVKYFGLGNEIYGNWQAGQKNAAAYAAWCREAILQMKTVDPTVRIVVCGLGRPDPEWDRTVLFETVGLADMISVHNYFGRPVFRDCMAASRICDQMLESLNATIDEAMDTSLGVHSRTRRELGMPPTIAERPRIAFDEWNVWYRSSLGRDRYLYEIFNYMDALTVASILHEVLRHNETIGLSNISLAVDALASIMTDRTRCVRQTIWYPQKLLHDAHSGRLVRSLVDAPTFKAKHERFFCGIVSPEKAVDESVPSLLHFDDVSALDVVVTHDAKRKKLVVSVIQKLADRPLMTRFTWRGLQPAGSTVKVSRLTGPSLLATNTLDSPNNVGITSQTRPVTDTFTFPPASLTVLEFKVEDAP